jgi:ankyrin repeat protein
VAVDGMNNSAVQAIIDMNIAHELVNLTDNYGMTTMHIAAINFDYEIFNMISSLKPDVTIKDSENKTAIDYLKENEEIEEDIKSNLENISI